MKLRAQACPGQKTKEVIGCLKARDLGPDLRDASRLDVDKELEWQVSDRRYFSIGSDGAGRCGGGGSNPKAPMAAIV